MLAGSLVLGALAAGRPFDFTAFERAVFPKWLAQFRAGAGAGEWSIEPRQNTSFYGSTDVVYYYHILGLMEGLSPRERREWADVVNSFQDEATGQYIPRPDERWAGLFPWHASGSAMTALWLLGRFGMRHPPAFATDIAANRSAWAPWLTRFLNASAVPRPGHDPTTA